MSASSSASPRRYSSPSAPSALPGAGRTLQSVLVSLLFLSMALTFTAAEWTNEGSGVFLPVVCTALLCGMAVTHARVESLFMCGFGFLAGFCFCLCLAAWQIPETDMGLRQLLQQGHTLFQSQAYRMLSLWFEWMAELVRGRIPSGRLTYLVFLLNMSLLLWWIAYFGIWTMFRFGQTWRTVGTTGIVTAVNTYYAPSSITILFVLFVLFALLLLVSTHLDELQRHWYRERVRFSPDILFDFMRNGLVFSVLAVGLAWGAPKLGLFHILNQQLQPISEAWETFTDSVAQANEGLNQQMRGSNASFLNTLTLGGPRRPSNTPVMQVRALEGRYWRANTYDAFDGAQWTNTQDRRRSIPSDQTIPAPGWESRARLQQTVMPLRDLGYVVLAAPDVLQTSVDTLALYDVVPASFFETPAAPGPDLALEEGQGETLELQYIQTRERLTPDTPYQVVSALSTASVWDLEQAPETLPAAIAERYLQIPASLEPRVMELALDLTAQEATRYGKAKALERALRRFPYDESIAAAPRGVDPVSYFLFDIQRGYCDYYATSMVMMLRTLGIPARLAAGYAEGAYDDATDTFLVTEEDAHSWVEVYFGGLGWIEFEPTANESPLLRDPGGPPLEEPRIPGAQAGETLGNGPDLTDLTEPESDLLLNQDFTDDFIPTTNSNPGLPTWLLVGLALAALALAAWALTRMRSQSAVRERKSSQGLVYGKLMRWARRGGVQFSDSATPMERRSVLLRLFPQLTAPITAIVTTYVRFRYGMRAGLAHTADQMAMERQWNAVQWPLVRAWLRFRWRRLIRRGSPSPGS